MKRSALALAAAAAAAGLLVGAPASQALAAPTFGQRVLLDPGGHGAATVTATATDTAGVTPTVAEWPQWATVAPTAGGGEAGHDHAGGEHGTGQTSGDHDMSEHMTEHTGGHDMTEHMTEHTGGHDDHAATPTAEAESHDHGNGAEAEAEGDHGNGAEAEAEGDHGGHGDGGHGDSGPAPDRPRTTVLGSFAAVNAGVLVMAAWMRRRTRGEQLRRKDARAAALSGTTPATPHTATSQDS